ncbi:MAG: hypothetical protein JXB39_02605 [Deltaproteobacteria bacterium]|nr:hypothetical protein [Deltaproteobacteria bacterium]
MNPLLRAERLALSHRRVVEPLAGPAGLLGPPLLALVSLRWTGPILLGFGPSDSGAFCEGFEGVLVRLGLLLVGAGLLVAHGVALRPPDRPVLDPLPLDASLLRPVLTLRVLRSTAGVFLASVVILLPLGAVGRPGAVATGAFLLLGTWLAAAPLGCTGCLAAVHAARSPRYAHALELLRGTSPPMQAALIWVPGVAFAVGAGAVLAGSHGAALLSTGGPPLSVAGLLVPFALALASWSLLGPLLDRAWVATTLVLAEVDAAWARVQGAEDRLHVHLEWTVRWFPPPLRVHVLRTFRHAWRGLRTWVVGAWGLGLLGAVAGWGPDPAAPGRALAVSAAAAGLIGALGIRLEASDPPWLGRAVGLPLLPHLAGRAGALLLLIQGAVVPACLAVLLRHGGPALPLLAVLEGTVLACSVLGTAAGPLRRASVAAYAPLAVGVWILATRCLP